MIYCSCGFLYDATMKNHKILKPGSMDWKLQEEQNFVLFNFSFKAFLFKKIEKNRTRAIYCSVTRPASEIR